MTKTLFRAWAGFLLIPVMALIGCGQADRSKPAATDHVTGTVAATKADDRDRWWCAEHGVPEEECSMCSAKVARTCKANGDWCEKHDRAKSQCFLCDPSLKAKFAAKYKARYGTEPPPIEDEKEGSK